jgi:hypothetical protein
METTAKATHTPGPWYCHDDGFVYSEATDANGTPYRICDPHCDEGPDPDEREANARLIAASPDLLAALKEMYALYADHAQYDDSEEQHEVKAIGQAREAIAKATE